MSAHLLALVSSLSPLMPSESSMFFYGIEKRRRGRPPNSPSIINKTEREERRKIGNRESARRYRMRKEAVIASLTETVKERDSKIFFLEGEVSSLRFERDSACVHVEELYEIHRQSESHLLQKERVIEEQAAQITGLKKQLQMLHPTKSTQVKNEVVEADRNGMLLDIVIETTSDLQNTYGTVGITKAIESLLTPSTLIPSNGTTPVTAFLDNIPWHQLENSSII